MFISSKRPKKMFFRKLKRNKSFKELSCIRLPRYFQSKEKVKNVLEDLRKGPVIIDEKK